MKRGSTSYRLLDRYIGITALCAASVFSRRRAMPDDVNIIGILSSPTIGDTLLTAGTVLDIRRAYPKAQLIFLAFGGSRTAAKLLPAIDKIVDISVGSPIQTISVIQSLNLDILIDFTQWQRITAIFSGFSGARCRIGFKSQGQSRHWLYDFTADHSDQVHEVENFRALIRAIGVEASAEPELIVPRAQDAYPGGIIVFHPWASGQRSTLREWKDKNWVALARRLATDGTHFYITGSPSERPRAESLAAQIGQAGLSAQPFVRPGGLAGVSQLLQAASLVVSVNTGIMHLAAILGAATIALNGPTATHRWGPHGPTTSSVEPRGGQGGYLHFGFEFAGKPTDCMDRIHVDDVASAAAALLSCHSQSVSA